MKKKTVDTKISKKEKPAKRKYTRRQLNLRSQPEKNKRKIDPDDFYNRLSERHGNLFLTARYYNISRVTLWHYIKDNPELEKIVKDVKETTVDVVESTMMKEILGIPLFDGEGSDKKQIGWIKEPNSTMMIFWLKTQAKHRGYTERQENVNVTVATFDDLPSLDDVT